MFAPMSVYFKCGDGSILGAFDEVEDGNMFEFSANNDDLFSEWPHKVWVSSPREGIESGFRYAMVKKTVVYIITDEDAEGNPIVEKWKIKNYREYSSKSYS